MPPPPATTAATTAVAAGQAGGQLETAEAAADGQENHEADAELITGVIGGVLDLLKVGVGNSC